jgi:hypothetical protein
VNTEENVEAFSHITSKISKSASSLTLTDDREREDRQTSSSSVSHTSSANLLHEIELNEYQTKLSTMEWNHRKEVANHEKEMNSLRSSLKESQSLFNESSDALVDAVEYYKEIIKSKDQEIKQLQIQLGKLTWKMISGEVEEENEGEDDGEEGNGSETEEEGMHWQSHRTAGTPTMINTTSSHTAVAATNGYDYSIEEIEHQQQQQLQSEVEEEETQSLNR